MAKHCFYNDSYDGKALKYLALQLNSPMGGLFKALRNKDIRVNGTRIKNDVSIKPGDSIEVYLPQQIEGKKQEKQEIKLVIAYEDENILVVNKPQGVAVHPTKETGVATLIDTLVKYANGKFEPRLCHRIDRNTGGLLLVAKNKQSLDLLLLAIEQKNIEKYYKCVVVGKPNKPTAKLTHYLSKNEAISKVFIHNDRERGDLTAVMSYKVIKSVEGLSLLKVSLETGRMHQIRAQLAHIGHPILGDGKYGNTSDNRKYTVKLQQLWAYRLVFHFPKKSHLAYLDDLAVEIDVPFDK